MSDFSILQEKAGNLPNKLIRYYKKNYSYGGIFCTCVQPWISNDAIIDARLVCMTAFCLDHYSGATDDLKLVVLKGMYFYVWQHYKSTLQWFSHNPFITILREHLEIEGLEDL